MCPYRLCHMLIHCCVLLFFAPTARGQVLQGFDLKSVEPAHKVYAEEVGLWHLFPYTVFHDSKGRAWVGTTSGPAYFRDRQMHYATDEKKFAIPNWGSVYEICEDEKSRVWFADRHRNVYYFENNQFNAFAHGDTIQAHAPRKRSVEDFRVSDGHIYMGYSRMGIYRYSEKGEWSRPLTSDSVDRLQLQIVQTQQGVVAGCAYPLASYGGELYETVQLSFLDARDGDITHLNVPYPGYRLEPEMRVHAANWGDSVYVAYENYCHLIYRKQLLKSLRLDRPVTGITLDKTGTLWIGDGDGVWLYDRGLKTLKQHWFEGIDIVLKTAINDFEGGTWLPTGGKGIIYIPEIRIKKFEGITSSDGTTETISKGPNGSICMVVSGKSLLKIDSTGAVTKLNLPAKYQEPYFTAMHLVAPNRHLLLGPTKTLVLENDAIISSGKGARCKSIAVGDTTWFASLYSVWAQVGDSSLLISKFPSETMRVSAILPNGENAILLGTNEGLYSRRNFKWTKMTYGHPELEDQINGLFWMEDSSLCLTTRRNGILFLKNNILTKVLPFQPDSQKQTLFSTSGGTQLNSSTVFGNVAGAFQLIEWKEGKYESRIMPGFEGIPSTLTTYGTIWQNGQLWVKTQNSLLRLDDSLLMHYNEPQLPLYLEEVKIGGAEVPADTAYTIKYHQNFLWFRFAGLSYRARQPLKYRFRLSSVNPDWIESESPEIQYNSLAPGDYLLETQVRNLSGTWSTNTQQISITVLPPIWGTWWFWVLIFMLLIAAISALFRWRLHRINEKNVVKNQLLTFQQRALAAQMNPHFIFNAMNSIQRFIVKNEKMEAYNYLEKFGSLIRNVMEQSGKEYISLAAEIETITVYLELEKLRFEKQFDFEIKLDSSLGPHDIELPPMLVQPYVENAVKHGLLKLSGHGQLKISFQPDKGNLVCVIEDNGVGRGQAMTKEKHRSFGMRKTADRLMLLSEKLKSPFSVQVEDLKAKDGDALGTRVVLVLGQL